MKKLMCLSMLITTMGASTTAFAWWEPSYWRCQADQLYQTGAGAPPAAPIAATYNLAQARRVWAQNGMSNGPFVPLGQQDQDFWIPSLNTDVTTAWNSYNIELYPVYQSKTSPYPVWIGPGPNAPMAEPRYATTYNALTAVGYGFGKPFSKKIGGVCEAGCYTPDQMIRFKKGSIPILAAFQAKRTDVVTLAPNASFDSLSFIVNEVARYTVDKDDAEQDILTLKMQSGGEITVTLEHPLLTPEGSLRRAREFSVGDALVKEDGSSDTISTITPIKWFGKAYNLRPVTTDLTSNILVAQGYLNGSARFQNEYVEYMNRVIMRQTIPVDVL